MSRENVDLVRRTVEAWNAADLDAWLAAADPDVEWYTALEGLIEGFESAYRGHEGLREGWRQYREFWQEFRVEPLDYRDLGDRVLVLARAHARGRASGIEVDPPLAMLFTFRDGRIASSKDYLSHEKALEAAGLDE